MHVSDHKVLSKTKAKEFRDRAAGRIGSSDLDAALKGDLDAVWTLIQRTGHLAEVALAAYWGATPTDAYQDLLSFAWSDDWTSLRSEAGEDHRLLRRMFRAGKYRHGLFGRIEVYRGVRGLEESSAGDGLSWTLNRDVACYFACMRAKFAPSGEPRVVKAVVDARDLLYYENNRFEEEVIVGRSLKALTDPDPSSWQSGSERYQAQYIEPFRDFDRQVD